MNRVLVPLAEGFEDIEALTVVDVLRRGGVEVVTAAIGGSRSVRSQTGVTMEADALFADVGGEKYEAIVLPGGGQGTQNLKNCESLLARLQRQKADGRLLCAICAAPTVLAFAGVFNDDTHATVYPTCVLDLDRPSAGVPVVEDGQFITGQAPGSAMLFALVVLKALEGENVMRRVARGLVTNVLD